MSNSPAIENYLKNIYKLSQHGRTTVTTNQIADRMQTRAATVTDMIKKLHNQKLIKHEKYMGVMITEKGIQVALSIIRKHRLWEAFLVEKLGFGWDQVHEIAEQLEHVESEELIKRLDRFLNYPKFDPHGDPIPDVNGQMKQESLKTLSAAPKNSEVSMAGVVNHKPEFLQYLEKNNIVPGTNLKVLDITGFDNSMVIRTATGKKLHISNMIASNILIRFKA